jgi:general secretion pathway protein B
MSYILDALRRAESERVKDQVPGLHDMTLAPAEADDGEADRRPRWPWIASAASVVLLAAAGGWWALRERPSLPAPAVASPVAQVPVEEAPPVQQAVAVAPPPAPVLQAPPPVPSAPPLVIVPPQGQPAPKLPVAPPAARPLPPVQTAPSTALVAPDAGDERPAPGLAELPEDFRRSLPAMRFEGTVYSDIAANRMLMVNGQLLHEGEKIGEVVVERIRPKSAQLQFRGQRFEFSR